uniref:Uncharacterized protein n=1 Tax=Emiliania huxleyi TaxID=2903 RepID=A0A6T0E1J5_EMIHU|mmetsp:Transcript_11221/g.33676  ORF Transcript_11221/g.33676 Transcript_11221/m.33676 type:complete len:211 (+) Transcript_11221:372-1004(+)
MAGPSLGGLHGLVGVPDLAEGNLAGGHLEAGGAHGRRDGGRLGVDEWVGVGVGPRVVHALDEVELCGDEQGAAGLEHPVELAEVLVERLEEVDAVDCEHLRGGTRAEACRLRERARRALLRRGRAALSALPSGTGKERASHSWSWTFFSRRRGSARSSWMYVSCHSTACSWPGVQRRRIEWTPRPSPEPISMTVSPSEGARSSTAESMVG